MAGELDLDALAALEQAATPGPWDYETELLSPDVDITGFHWRPYGHTYSPEWGGDSPQAAADGALIAAARNALPRLLALARAGERLEALWRKHGGSLDAEAQDWLCPECCAVEPDHTATCPLAAALADWQVAKEGR